MGAPPAAALQAMLAPTTKVFRQVDIYESDNETLWMEGAPLIDGSVSLDQGRDERRTIEIEFSNENDDLASYPGGFWYDKIIKPRRGVRYTDANGEEVVWSTSLGEFLIDEISEPRFPRNIQVKGRDFTKRLLDDKFPTSTSFAKGTPIEDVVDAIALNGNIDKRSLPSTGEVLPDDMVFEADTSRWSALSQIGLDFGWEIFFDADGYLAMEEFQDPVSSPEVFTFKTGPGGTLVEFGKRTYDTRIKNHIIVLSENTDGLQIFAEAENNQPDSPTRIEKLGRRSDTHKSSVLDTVAKCQKRADEFLKISALESFDVNFESLVLPWLEVGKILRFEDPNPSPDDPERYLMSTLTIPIKLGAMSGLGRRVTVVG